MNTMAKLRKGIETNIDMFEWFGKHHKGMNKSQYMKLVESATAWKDILNGIYALIEQGSKAIDYLEYQLEDGVTSTGGISYMGETLLDFILENNISVSANMRVVNQALIDNGIKPIKIKMSEFEVDGDYEINDID